MAKANFNRHDLMSHSGELFAGQTFWIAGRFLKIDLVVKNEELPLRTQNHCREVFSLVNQAITDAHAKNGICTSGFWR